MRRTRPRPSTGLVLGLLAAACSETVPTELTRDASTARRPPGHASVVEVTARGLTFEAPAETPSGWTTLRLRNESRMTHFAVLERLPEGRGIEDHQTEVAPIFQEGMDLLNAGDFQAALARFGELPAWFFEIVFMGGPGLLGPGGSTETTVFLEPGTYLLECYVKTNGRFHSVPPTPGEFGMVHELTVTETPSGSRRPTATLELSVSSSGGIDAVPVVRPGWHTVAVRFEDQFVHEHFLGHDVHLVRLEAGTDVAELARWVNWTLPTGLETPAPAIFLGGLHEMPAGNTAYLHVRLRPGRYAWIAEVPDPVGKGMLKTFTVPAGRAPGS